MSTTQTQFPQEPIEQNLKTTEVHIDFKKYNLSNTTQNSNYENNMKKKTPSSWISNLVGFNPNMGVSLVDNKSKKF